MQFILSSDSINTIHHYYVNVDAGIYTVGFRAIDMRRMIITADHGKMSGNRWVAPANINFEKVHFHAFMKDNPARYTDTTVWLKRAKNPPGEMTEDMDLPVVPKDLPGRK